MFPISNVHLWYNCAAGGFVVNPYGRGEIKTYSGFILQPYRVRHNTTHTNKVDERDGKFKYSKSKTQWS